MSDLPFHITSKMVPPFFHRYEAIDDQSKGGANFDLVVPDQWQKPACKVHGAMNKVSSSANGGFWRCLQGQCRAGCKEIQ